MKKTFRSLVTSVLLGLLAAGIQPRVAFATQGDILTYTGSGALNSREVFRIDVNGQVISSSMTSNGDIQLATPSDIVFGSTTTAISTTTTSGGGQGIIFYATLVGSPNASEGSVLIATSCPAGTSGVCVAVSLAAQTQTNVIGVAAAAATTTTVVGVMSDAWALALGTGTINPGDILATSAISAGYLQAYSNTVSSGVVGVALGSNTSGSGNLLKVRLK